MNLKITDIGAINKADINITKINVVGGVNSSGKTTASKLLYCYLKSADLLENEGFSNINSDNIKFTSNEHFSDVFYLDTISILDLKDLNILNFDHIKHIKQSLEMPNQDASPEITSKIRNLISDNCYSSAGIKQIGVIQILLQNNALKRDSFLIIDEPEANLHPEWQIKFAEILITLTKELNITLYLNSYSPIFIEAVSLYAQYCDLIKDTNFYLTKKQVNNKYDFKKIDPNDMGEVYEDLTKPYDMLDKLKAKIIFKE